MLILSSGRTGTLVNESFYRQLSFDFKWKKDIQGIVEPFLKECIQICWLMVNKDPPMYWKVSEKRGSKIIKKIYKLYSRNGEKVGYLVWPVLFLHEKGPLLLMGVVHPI